ncbi:hypothetical protein LTR66_017706 [Elasticomyces elasticus]|nr:hypothetical protein LTR66_017706 [Elasticomyces elasticus]
MGIKAHTPPKTNRFNNRKNMPVLGATQRAAFERLIKADVLPLRTGALAIKRGMTAVYNPESGERIPCTVLQLEQNQVVHLKTMRTHGYFAVCIGAGEQNPKNVTKPQLGHFSLQGVSPKRHLQEFRVKDEKGLLAVGQRVTADWFMVGQYVDTKADCNGQGGGSRVYPGKKMAGRMGGQRVTVQNLKVLQTDGERGLVLVSGAVAGPKGTIVMIQDAKKKPWPNVPLPPSPAEINLELRKEIDAKLGDAPKEAQKAEA